MLIIISESVLWSGPHFYLTDPLIYSGGETSGLESAYTSPSVHHKDFIEQYLNKLSYLPGDVITNSEPMLSLAATQPQHTYNLPTSYSQAGLNTAGLMTTSVNTAIEDLLEKELAQGGHYNSFNTPMESDIDLGRTPLGPPPGPPPVSHGPRTVDMLEIPGKAVSLKDLIWIDLWIGNCLSLTLHLKNKIRKVEKTKFCLRCTTWWSIFFLSL